MDQLFDAAVDQPAPLRGLSVVVVEDAPEIQLLVTSVLESEGCDVSAADDGPEAIDLVRELDPTVVVLDVGLPTMDGFEVCRELRTFTDAYIIMLTARDHEIDRVQGLRLGADDYLTKPFSALELVARIEAIARRPRRPAAEPSAPTVVGDLVVDQRGRQVLVDGEPVAVTKIEFDLLDILCRRAGTALSREVLTSAVWGEDWIGDDHLIDVHIANLRKKIDGNRPHITTVRGVGYRIDAPGSDTR